MISSKILLFGEHAVLIGSEALAAPLGMFSGRWVFREDRDLQYGLRDLGRYLKLKGIPIDHERFKEELDKGLCFLSDIPVGYGAGSSGALIAGVLLRYQLEDCGLFPLAELQRLLGLMESFFHGRSSGLDPLICYLNRAVLIKEDKSVEVVDGVLDLSGFFLIPTDIPRKTEPWVNLFLSKCEDSFYKTRVLDELVGYNQCAISALLQNDKQALAKNMHEISHFQFLYFHEFIPAAFHSLWQEGLSGDNYKLKLCGAGGGGFILGYGGGIANCELRITNC
jgi:mevalonate kinase